MASSTNPTVNEALSSIFPGCGPLSRIPAPPADAVQTLHLRVDASETRGAHLLYTVQGNYHGIINHHSADFPQSVARTSSLSREAFALIGAIIRNKDKLNQHFNLIVPSLQMYCWIRCKEGPMYDYLRPFSYSVELVDRDEPGLANILSRTTVNQIFNSM